MKTKKKTGKGVRSRIQRRIHKAETRARQSGQQRDMAFLFLWRLLVQIVGQWHRDRCPQRAAALSFQFLLSIVPALAVVFAAIRITGSMGAQSSLVTFLSEELVPLSREEVSKHLLEWAGQINVESVGLIGLPATALVAFLTFNSLELAINDIWRIQKRRSFWKRILTFYATATIAPFLLGLSLYQATRFGLNEGWVRVCLGLAMTFSALFIINLFVPRCKVSVRAAAVGALVNTLAVQLAQIAFTAYVNEVAFARYAGIYGTLAVVPLCLIWVYWSWSMLLLGVEVTHIVQNFHLLESERRSVRLRKIASSDALLHKIAVQVLLELDSHQDESAKALPLSAQDLGERLDLAEDELQRVLDTMLNKGLVAAQASRYKLARSLSAVNLEEVHAAFRANASTEEGYDLALMTVLDEAELATRNTRAGISIEAIAVKLKQPNTEPISKKNKDQRI